MHPATRRRIGFTALGIVAALILILAVAALVDRDGQPDPAPVTTTTATAALSLPPAGPSPSSTDWKASPPALPDAVHYAYARIDSTDGSLQLGGDVDRRPLDQLLVPGLAEDYLNTLTERHDEPGTADREKLRDALAGDPAAVAWLVDQVDGADQAFTRIVAACQLDNTATAPAQAAPLEIARYAACLREGAITDPDGAVWVLDQMRATRTGIGETRGDASLAQQNSTVRDGDRYRTGCLAIGPWWTASVLVDYDTDRGEKYGEAACGVIAGALFPPDTQKVPERKTSPAPTTATS